MLLCRADQHRLVWRARGDVATILGAVGHLHRALCHELEQLHDHAVAPNLPWQDTQRLPHQSQLHCPTLPRQQRLWHW